METNSEIKKSQLLMKRGVEVFKNYKQMLADSIPEHVDGISISLYGKEIYGCIEVRVSVGNQTSFFTIAQCVNRISDFWYFFENVVNGAQVSYWYQDQEGPDVAIIIHKLDNDFVRVTQVSNGWWEFYDRWNHIERVYPHEDVITLDIVCLKQEFIKNFYEILKSLRYRAKGDDEYDLWEGMPVDSKIIRDYVKDCMFSSKWDFGCREFDDDISVSEPKEIEQILDSIYYENDDILQLGVLYKCGHTRVCHTMEIPEIAWFRKEFLSPIQNNKPAKYFDSHCSCDFEFVSKVINDKYIRLIITDKNDEEKVVFDYIISKDDFLKEMDSVFNEIYKKVDALITDYGDRHNLSNEDRELLRTRLYEWN